MKIHSNFKLHNSFLNNVNYSDPMQNRAKWLFEKESQADTVSFGSNGRIVKDAQGNMHRNVTLMFRDDFGWNWEKFVESLDENFSKKDKVNVICQACSDGSEPYTLVISLLENLGEEKAQKFLPLIAKDFDDKILAGPQAGLINLSEKDIEQFKKRNIDFDKYFDESKDILIIENDFDKVPKKTYAAKAVLQKNIIFKQGDVFEDLRTLEDNSNTVFLFRNALEYLKDWDTVDRFLNLVDEKLKPGSVFLSGETQLSCAPEYIDKTLKGKNFKYLFTCQNGQRSYGTYLKKEEIKPQKKSLWKTLFGQKS